MTTPKKRGRKPKQTSDATRTPRSLFYPREEQETTCVFDVQLNKWRIYSTSRKHLSRLVDKFGPPDQGEYRNDQLIAGSWLLPAKVVSFRKLEKTPRKRMVRGNT